MQTRKRRARRAPHRDEDGLQGLLARRTTEPPALARIARGDRTTPLPS
ncbi:hypothetical protein PRJ39_00570 [Lysobacter enzymogenes]|nr:hypothetical protein [Lysobacter sp. yr284]